MPRPSDIDAAVLARLGADQALRDVMPNGVYFGYAGPGIYQFVLVAILDQFDEIAQGAHSHTEKLYLVKAVALSSTNPNMPAAEDRIDALLGIHADPLTASGWEFMTSFREKPVRETEVSDVDPKVVWFHWGGEYRVVMSSVP